MVDGDARRRGGYTGKDVNVEDIYKYDGHFLFFRRNRDLGTISVHVRGLFLLPLVITPMPIDMVRIQYIVV